MGVSFFCAKTGTKVYKDDGTSPLLMVSYYDDKGRLIQSASQNHLGGTDYVTNTYNFPGELLTSKREHKPSPSGATTTILTTNKYDHTGRLLETKKKVNAQTEILQSRLVYNETGQLKEKKLHSENGGTSFLSTVSYSYNERGWATRIGSAQFTEELKYSDGTVPQYNGNVSQQLWGHAATTSSTFSYSYDRLNRLTNGTSTGTVMSEVLTYDDMGNIKTLKRDAGTTISYSYNNSQKSNRLASLSGGLTGSYSYDVNGNALTDRTGMTFSYNHLNLPKTASKTGTSVGYLYDAMGAKLQKIATVSGTTTQRDYIAGIEYSKVGAGASSIERIATEEGYLQNSSGTYSYYYNLTDHLGNVRSVFQRTGATTLSVVQKQDYYPFGKTKSILTGGINRYLYNGKEVQPELGDQLDYGARFYDAEIGRWNVVDPLSDEFENVSPYNYGMNNPILMIDPDGMATDTAGFFNQVIETVTVWANRPASGWLKNVGDITARYSYGDWGGEELPKTRGEALVAYGSYVLEVWARSQHGKPGTPFPISSHSSTIAKQIAKGFSKKIHMGKQGKHVVGHNNYQKGKSVLKSDAQGLLNDFHHGDVNSVQKINQSKVRVDFGKVVGEFIKDGVSVPTTKAIIHNSNTGAHIVPATP